MSRRLDISTEARTTMRYLLHEIRTPLGQILGYSEMLEEEVRDRGQADLVPDLEKIQNAAKRLLDFLEDAFEPNNKIDLPSSTDETFVSSTDVNALDSNKEVVGAPIASAAASGSLLVVDDEPENRDLLSRRLRGAGYEVATAASGREALHAIEQSAFDLVLLDVMMPEMSGLEVLAAVRRSRSVSDLPIIMATALGSSDDIVEALRSGANDYVTKPFDFAVVFARIETQLSLQRAAVQIAELAQQLEIRNNFILSTFGRYVSEEVVTTLLQKDDGLEMGGEKRRISTMMSDVRGFTALGETLSPRQVVSLLNRYLGAMSDIIQDHGGTIEEFIGDGIIAFFGAPLSYDNDAERSVAAALAMQQAMAELNAGNIRSGLPEIEMGIGIARGDAIVGNIGSERRAMYGAIGSSVNLAARIESYALGGDVFIDDATLDEIGDILRTDRTHEVHPKGIDAAVRIHRVIGIEGKYNIALEKAHVALTNLSQTIPLRYSLLTGKDVDGDSLRGDLVAASRNEARIRSSARLAEFSNLRLEILDGHGEPLPGAFYAKVVEGAAANETALVCFTSRSPALDTALEKALRNKSSV